MSHVKKCLLSNHLTPLHRKKISVKVKTHWNSVKLCHMIVKIMPILLLNIIHVEDFRWLVTQLCWIFRMISKAARMLQRDIEGGKKQHKAMNDNLVQLVRAARVSNERIFTDSQKQLVFFHNISWPYLLKLDKIHKDLHIELHHLVPNPKLIEKFHDHLWFVRHSVGDIVFVTDHMPGGTSH